MRWNSCRPNILSLFFVTLFHCAVTGLIYPAIVSAPFSNLLAGQQVGGYFAWLFWWWRYALMHHLSPFHSNLLMFPAGIPVFPHSPVNEIPALLLQTVSSTTFTTNFLLLVSHVLSGVTMYALGSEITKDRWASLLASFLYAYSPYMLTQHYIGQVIEATIFFNPLLVLALYRYYKRPSNSAAMTVAAALTGVFLSGPYVGFSFGLVFVLAGVLFDVSVGERMLLRSFFSLPLVLWCGTSVIIAIIAFLPLISLPRVLGGGSEFFSPSLAMFIDLPFWHTSALVRSIRILKSSGAPIENSMGYFGIVPIVAIIISVRRKYFSARTEQFFGSLLIFSAILSLGATLQITPTQRTIVPLPYTIFRHLPLLSSFRVPARILMTVSLASSVLVALTFSKLLRGRRTWGFLACAGLMVVVWYEWGLSHVGQRYASSVPSTVYTTIKEDGDNFAILELPQHYVPGATLYIPAQYYMLFQTYHEKPMVLGCPTRYFLESLSLTENTPVLYEFTHPENLKKLLTLPELAVRQTELTAKAKSILAAHKIKYVVYHRHAPLYDKELHKFLELWLTQIFGTPSEKDGDKIFLFKVY